MVRYVVLFSLALLSYFYVLDGDFIGDDISRILFNSELISLQSALTGVLGDRPLVMFVTYWICHIFGVKAFYFRIFSLLLHSLVGLQVFYLIQDLAKNIQNEGKNIIAFCIAIVFVLHPLHSQAITTAIQSGVLLSGLFGVLSIRYFLKASEQGNSNYVKSIGSYLLGILSKSNSIFIPLYFYFDREKIKNINRPIFWISFLFVTCVPAFFYLQKGKNLQEFTLAPFQYFLVQTEVLFTYFKLILVPTNLKFLYSFDVPKELFPNINWLYLLAHVGIFLGGIKLIKDKTLKLLFLGFYISFLPESSFFPISHVAFEHRTYFPMIFLSTFLGFALIKINWSETIKKIVLGCTILISLIYFALNQDRNLEIKRYGAWAEHTLNEPTEYHFTSYLLMYNLIKGKGYDQVLPLIEKYDKRFPDESYKVFYDIIGYYTQKESKEHYYDRFAAILEDPKTSVNIRLFVNSLFFSEFVETSDDYSVFLRAENVLRVQLPVFFKHYSKFFKPISHYFYHARSLLTGPHSQKLAEDKVRVLKIKFTLYLYYGEKYEALENEIKDALALDPTSTELNELYNFYNRSKLGRMGK